MKKAILFALIVFSLQARAEVVETIISGDAALHVEKLAEGKYSISFKAYDVEFNSDAAMNPALMIDAKEKQFFCHYTEYNKAGDVLTMTSRTTLAPSTAVMLVTDTYTPQGNGAFELSRRIKVESLGDNPYKTGFWSSFGLQFATSDQLLQYDYFIPGVWYKANFLTAGNLPAHLPQKTDTDFFYRDDRTPLPVLAMRSKRSGVTVTIVDQDSKSETVLADSKSVETNAEYQFGGVGVTKFDDSECFTAAATYPGNDKRASGLGERRHPFAEGFDRHSYKVFFKFSKTDNYASAVSEAYTDAFNLYNPTIYKEDLPHAYEAITQTCDYYFLSPEGNPNVDVTVHKPGFPWNVFLTGDFSTNSDTYEIGFVGAQTEAGYALLRAGTDNGNGTYIKHGTAVLDFWANEGLSTLGLPKTRYYSEAGNWDSGAHTSMRQACTGMTSVLDAWCFYNKQGTNKSNWLEACRKFGDWLVANQNTDGSWYMEYHPFKITAGKHPAGKTNKYLTVCALRYLIQLYIVTGEESYKKALDLAANFSYNNIHKQYQYVACVIDNPQTIDSESGQQALQNFLAMYDFTKEQKWLDAAEQAAIYTASWTFMHEVPVESDQTINTDWPKDRSIVGQHLIAIGHSASDLGFAWSSFAYYRLYVITGKELYLQLARISAHNTKQSMNLNQALYPGQQEGLQQEAFQVGTTKGNGRRQNSIMQALTWNFAAHLDPMIRFKDAYGTVDLEEVEKMSKEEIKRLDDIYSKKQAADYGDVIHEPLTEFPITGNGDGLKGSYWYGSQDFGNPIPDGSKGGANYASSGDFAGNAYLKKPGEHKFDRIDKDINFDWGAGNPFNNHTDGDACGQHCFSIKWTGYILAPITGEVILDLTYCDDAFSIEVWDADNMKKSIAKYDKEYLTGWNWDKDFWTIPVQMQKDKFYYIELKYYDGSWNSHICLKWSSEERGFEPVIIPQAQLYSELPDTDGIEGITCDNKAEAIYNLNGIRVADISASGIYIKNGRKFVVTK